MTTNASLRDRARTAAERVFGCDVRSLAVFRIGLGVLLISDLWLRWPSIQAMMTDDGYFTRAMAEQFHRWYANWDHATYWSVHKLSGALEFQVAVFAVAAVLAALMIVGWHTRLVTIASWILVASVNARCPLITTSGDFLLKMLVFWGMFLPLGAVWSLDARRRRRRLNLQNVQRVSVSLVPRVVLTMATVGVIIQLCLMYWFTGLAKWNEIWLGGRALDYVLRLDIYLRPHARHLLDYPVLTHAMSIITVWGEVLLPCLLFIPWKTAWFRLLCIVAFWSLHIGVFATMDIGLFSQISMVGWLPLIPSMVWDCRRGRRLFPAIVEVDGSRQVGPWVRGGRRLANVVCGFFVLYFVCYNIANVGSVWTSRFMPRTLANIAFALNVEQHFKMFGIPPSQAPWFVYEAMLVDGSRVDLVHPDRPLTAGRPSDVAGHFPLHHWRKLHHNLVYPALSPFRQPLVDYAARQWNASHGPEQQIRVLTLTCYRQDIRWDEPNKANEFSEVWGRWVSPTNPPSVLDLVDPYDPTGGLGL
jgi:hypothetical protein